VNLACSGSNLSLSQISLTYVCLPFIDLKIQKFKKHFYFTDLWLCVCFHLLFIWLDIHVLHVCSNLIFENIHNCYKFCKFKINNVLTSHKVDTSAQTDQDPCCSLSVSLLVIEFVSEQHESWSDCVDAQAGLDPCWSQTHYVGFVVARLKCYAII
jgi:hypothetical protein